MRSRRLPQGVVTLFFTDIEGSTRLLERNGSQYRDLLLEHRRIIREAISENQGVEVDTQGDSFLVAFRDPHGAIEAAVSSQSSLSASADLKSAGLRVRLGIHTGAVSVADDGYVGITVHEGARIAAVAHGGQVLVSEATVRAANGAGGVSFLDLGEHALRDIERPVRLYQVLSPGLPFAFPPVRLGGPTARLAEIIGAGNWEPKIVDLVKRFVTSMAQ